jgi:hypothetical protein
VAGLLLSHGRVGNLGRQMQPRSQLAIERQPAAGMLTE